MNKRKAERIRVHQKFGGRCAYCGEELPFEKMQVDHMKPVFRSNESVNPTYRGRDTFENKVPSCAVCNRWKATMSVDVFRSEIEAQVERLRRDSAAFRMAERYWLVKEVPKKVIFWFETFA